MRKPTPELYERIIEAAPSAIVMLDRDGLIVLVNVQAERLFGWDRSELLGKPIEKLVPERFRDAHPGHRAGYLKQPVPWIIGAGHDLFALRRDGSEVSVEIGLNPIETNEGTLVLASMIDISARKRSDESRELAVMNLERTNRELVDAKGMLEHANSELERCNRELDEFAYAVSHDLRSPLRAIQKLAGWIREDVGKELPDEPRGWLEEIPDRIARMDRMLEDLLTYSRAIRAPSELEETEFTELVSDVVSILDVPTGFEVRVDGRDLRFSTHRVPLQQVLNNLIQNAINHHDEKSGTVTVTAHHGEPGMLEIEVADDGPGIPAHLRERAFGLFRSLSRTGEGSGGSGLGLALSRRVVENQGGRIGVRGNHPRGAVFHFSWPIRIEP